MVLKGDELLVVLGSARKAHLRLYAKRFGLSMGEVVRRAVDDLISFGPVSPNMGSDDSERVGVARESKKEEDKQ